jgi:hypothetical protein
MTNMFSSHQNASAFALALFAVSTLQSAFMLSGPVTALVTGEVNMEKQPQIQMEMKGMNQGDMGTRRMRPLEKDMTEKEKTMTEEKTIEQRPMMRNAAGSEVQKDTSMRQMGQTSPKHCEAIRMVVETSGCMNQQQGQNQMRQQNRSQPSTQQ